jgi:heptosyltransferase-2
MNPPPDPSSVRSLLVRANNWIGDVILASPALHALRRRFDRARISVLARPGVLAALEGSEDLDEILVYDPRRHGGALGRLSLIREIRGRRFDLGVLFQKAFEAAVFAKAGSVGRIYGYATDGRGAMLTDALPETEATRATHHARVFLDLAAAAGADTSDRTLRFPLGEADRQAAARILAGAHVEEGVPFVAIHPGASKRPRAWHPSRLGEAAGILARELGGPVLVLGGPGDREAGAEAARHAGASVADLTGKTTIKEMAALLERARLFLGSDSGPMHVAAAAGAPIVARFGPGTPQKTGPFLDAARWEAVTEGFPCSPCRQDFFRECPPAPSGKPWCLESIGVERVVEAGRAVLERTGRASVPA